jgi:hypothetical protein
MFATRCRSSEVPMAANVSITSPNPNDLHTVQVTNALGHSDSEFDVPIPTIQTLPFRIIICAPIPTFHPSRLNILAAFYAPIQAAP